MTFPIQALRFIALLSLLAAASVVSPSAFARDVGVLVSGIDSDKGEIVCSLYKGGKGFPHDDGDVVQTARYPALPPMLTCTFRGVEAGRYAVSVIHDENANGKIDKNFMGFSKEPWGVTNNVRPKQRAPRFSESTIHVAEDQLASHEVLIQR